MTSTVDHLAGHRGDPGSRAEPLYAALAADFKRQIDTGVLRVGEKLPSIRTVCQVRGVSTATAVEAYVRLERDGYVRARARSGFYVTEPPGHACPEPQADSALEAPVPVDVGALVLDVLRHAMDPRLVSLGVSTPGPTLLPNARLNRVIRSAAAETPLHGAVYGPLRGNVALRREIVKLAFTARVACTPDDLVVTAGGMEALNLALRAVASPGDVVAVESPTYFGVLQAIQSLGVRAVEVPADPRMGIDLMLLEHAIRRNHVKAVVSMTTCHNPLGTVMSVESKRAFVDLTAKYGVALIEDDIYADLTFGPGRPQAAKAFDRHGLVLWCGSFSKVLAPGLRVGWIAAGRFHDRVELLKSISSTSTATLPQLAIAQLLSTGFYGRHIRRLRARLVDQVAQYSHAISAAFPSGTRLTRPSGGNLLWIQLPTGVDGSVLYRRALEHGIAILPGEIFSAASKHRGYIRVSCGLPWSPAVERAIGRLGRLCRDLQ